MRDTRSCFSGGLAPSEPVGNTFQHRGHRLRLQLESAFSVCNRVHRARPPQNRRRPPAPGRGYSPDANNALKTCLLFFLLICSARGETPARVSFEPCLGMTRADLYHVKGVQNPWAVLVLCPGCNGNGEGLVSEPAWREFAREHNLGLVGLSFASEINDLRNGKGYYYAGRGSGKILLDGINQLFKSDLPILIYGFSGGAQFASRFVEWKPKRVAAWCAYSAGWWDEPLPSNIMPPGIVACGEDDGRLGASLVYFKQGRAIGKPWLWIGIPNNGHSPDKRVESFVRDYFAAIMKNNEISRAFHSGLWVDIDLHVAVEAEMPDRHPSITGWLPDAGLFNTWQSLNRGE